MIGLSFASVRRHGIVLVAAGVAAIGLTVGCQRQDNGRAGHGVTRYRLTRWLVTAGVLLALLAAPVATTAPNTVYRIDHVVDGDTVDLANGAKVRLVQIDTPEVYFGVECYGRQASAIVKRLLPDGTSVRLAAEPSSDRVDRYGRLLRYVVRARDGLNVNVYMVRIGAAAPYFYDGQRGKYAALLDRLARSARARHLGLWGACPRTPYDPYRDVDTR